MTPRHARPKTHLPDPRRTYRRRPGVYAILPLGQDLLVTAKADDPALQLPGGGIDPGEPPLRALHREVFEETGWRIAAPRRIATYRRFTYMPDYDLWAEKICTLYLAHPARKLGPPTEEGHRPLWLDVTTAPDLLDAGTGAGPLIGRILGMMPARASEIAQNLR